MTRDGGGGAPQRKQARKVCRSTPIRDVLKEGPEVIVQVSKEPIGTKGARVTSHVSLPGRYVVYLPTVDHIGISKRIGNDKERARLREAIEAMKPPQGGLIVRTVAEGLTKKQLKADVGYLVKLWDDVDARSAKSAQARRRCSTRSSTSCCTRRAIFHRRRRARSSSTIASEYERLVRFVEMFLPERVKDIELYAGRRADLRRVRHRGRDRARAVAQGAAADRRLPDHRPGRGAHRDRRQHRPLRRQGRKDLEETILKTNLEAVEEIAYQLRFRNIGGLIILDLIDMERASNREKVLPALLEGAQARTRRRRRSTASASSA